MTASPQPASAHAHPLSPCPLPQVEWHQGDAAKPETYAHLLPGTTAVVHTIGTLFEKSGYKSALKDGSVPHFASSVAAGVAGGGASANPLEKEEKRREGTYAAINRDTGALCCSRFGPRVLTGRFRVALIFASVHERRPLFTSSAMQR